MSLAIPHFPLIIAQPLILAKNMPNKNIVGRVFFDFNTNAGYSLGGMALVINHSISQMVDSSDPVISSLAVDVCALAYTLLIEPPHCCQLGAVNENDMGIELPVLTTMRISAILEHCG